jgi:hypothetical protein
MRTERAHCEDGDETEQTEPDRSETEQTEQKQPKRIYRYFDEYENLPNPEYSDDVNEDGHGFFIRMPEGSVMMVTGIWGGHKTNVMTKLVLDAVVDRE